MVRRIETRVLATLVIEIVYYTYSDRLHFSLADDVRNSNGSGMIEMINYDICLHIYQSRGNIMII